MSYNVFKAEQKCVLLELTKCTTLVTYFYLFLLLITMPQQAAPRIVCAF